jgi:ribosomal protein L11
MSKTNLIQKELKKLQSEERKDSKQVDKIKEAYIKEITSIKKEDLFPVPKKISLWKKIKILLLGN